MTKLLPQVRFICWIHSIFLTNQFCLTADFSTSSAIHAVTCISSEILQSNQKLHGLREELNAIVPYLEEMKKKKVERWNQFVHVIEQIKKISSEIRPADFVPFKVPVDQSDLSLRKLDELTKDLESLQKEKVIITNTIFIHFHQSCCHRVSIYQESFSFLV